MRTWSKLLIAAPVAAGLLAVPAAHADWHHDRGWHEHGYHHDNGGAVAGAVLGLGAAAVIGGIIASQQRPAYYPPPAAYYAPPPPVVYAPPPGYYPQY
jgi:hypothetical protein